jgi:sec-independent protein translocase protein TatB
MFDIGFWEILLIAVVALIVVGPERMPRLIRVTGLWIGRANASIQSVRNDISRELRADELRKAISDEGTPAVPRYVIPDESDVSISPAEPVETDSPKTPDLDKDNNGNG